MTDYEDSTGPTWIDISQELPKQSITCLVAWRKYDWQDYDLQVRYYNFDKGYFEGSAGNNILFLHDVSYWMLIPELPTKEPPPSQRFNSYT